MTITVYDLYKFNLHSANVLLLSSCSLVLGWDMFTPNTLTIMHIYWQGVWNSCILYMSVSNKHKENITLPLTFYWQGILQQSNASWIYFPITMYSGRKAKSKQKSEISLLEILNANKMPRLGSEISVCSFFLMIVKNILGDSLSR